MEVLIFITGAVIFGAGFALGFFLKYPDALDVSLKTIKKNVDKSVDKLKISPRVNESIPRTDFDEWAIEQKKITGKKPKVESWMKDGGIYGTGT